MTKKQALKILDNLTEKQLDEMSAQVTHLYDEVVTQGHPELGRALEIGLHALHKYKEIE